MKIMTPQERVYSVLSGETPDKVPFTAYECLIPNGETRDKLLPLGLCIVQRVVSYETVYNNVKIEYLSESMPDGLVKNTTIYTTPVGVLTNIALSDKLTSWTVKHVFTDQNDYKALKFLVSNTHVKSNYSAVKDVELQLGENYIVRDQIPLEPLQRIIVDFMGSETFCYEWYDNRDEIMELYSALVDYNRKTYDIVADSPVKLANYGGNVVPQIIGVDTFKELYVPHYNEAAEVLHSRGKKIGCHFDADNTLILNDIASSQLDYIEAYDVGMSPDLVIAAKVIPDKVFWLNYPSAWHLHPISQVYSDTKKLIADGQSSSGLIIGITEDVPPERLENNCLEILRALGEN